MAVANPLRGVRTDAAYLRDVVASLGRPAVRALVYVAAAPAWRDLPSWFVWGDADRNIPAEALRFMAERRWQGGGRDHRRRARPAGHPARSGGRLDPASRHGTCAGDVITEAASGDPRVKALVHVAAFLPDTV
ncbi:hypothetical protein GCM10010412_085140 [Nonomuraea recticatena]|uniref:Uncharacterized protein n=1 Tax=Nonomuraea recticatena TaxID=46178 RepID=A0ABP6FIN6_9ACTN